MSITIDDTLEVVEPTECFEVEDERNEAHPEEMFMGGVDWDEDEDDDVYEDPEDDDDPDDD